MKLLQRPSLQRPGLAIVLLALTTLAAAGSGGLQALLDTECFDCPWLDLPLDEWSSERNSSTREVLPWGQVVELPPIDYRQLAVELCECVQDTLEGPYGTHQPPDHYVRRNGTLLQLQGEPFRFAGFNAQQALSWAASGNPHLLADLDSMFSHAHQLGLRVGRVWANANAPKVRPPFQDEFDKLAPELQEPPWLTVQPAPGVLNETALEALDWVLELAGRYDIKLTLNLADYTGRFGPSPPGIEPYIQWVAGTLNLTGYTVLDFYTDERVKLIFKHNLCHLANRVSSRSGIKYKDSTTIFAWDIMNEPRCPACPGAKGSDVLAAWTDDMSSFLTCVDSNHMVAISTEGFFSGSQPQYISANPGPWALCNGVGFVELASLPHISYGSAHMYESMRGTWDEATRGTCGWECHMKWCAVPLCSTCGCGRTLWPAPRSAGKPFVLEEFSAPWAEERRNEMFRLVQDAFRSEWQNASSSAAGAMFWGATAGGHIDWDGWQVRLDGGQTGKLPADPAPTDAAQELKLRMPPGQRQWLADVDLMQASFRREDLAKECQEAARAKYSTFFAGYSSNSTLEIVRDLAAEASGGSAPQAEAPAPLDSLFAADTLLPVEDTAAAQQTQGTQGNVASADGAGGPLLP